MKNILQLERLHKAHRLIQQEKTGRPEEFANRLKISVRYMYKLLSELKVFGAPLVFDTYLESYRYTADFDFQLLISVRVLKDQELVYVYGGAHLKQQPILFGLCSEHKYL